MIVAVLLASLPAAPTSAQELAFPDGYWVGSAIFGGEISQADIFASGNGDVSFDLEVEDGQVKGGTLDLTGRGTATTAAGTGDLTVSSVLDLSGTAAHIDANGTLGYSGTVTVQGTMIPVNGSVPATGGFAPTSVSCDEVTGDLATESREAQKAAGFSTTVDAQFVAVLVAPGDPGKEGARDVQEYADVAQAIEDAIARAATIDGHAPPTVEELDALVHRVTDLYDRLSFLEACVQVPGFTEGLADPYFSALFRRLVLELLNHAAEISTDELTWLLFQAFNLGAVGPSSPDRAAADAALDRFVQVLSERVDQAGKRDVAALQQIYTAAQQLGLDDLAAKAKRALAEFVAGGGGPVETTV